MRNTAIHIILLVAAFQLFSCGNKQKNALPDMGKSYSRNSKKPFGTYVAYEMLKAKYANNSIQVSKKNFSKSRVSLYESQNLYVIISKTLWLNKEDVESMLQYVSSGNQLFISASYFDDLLLDTLGLKVQYDYNISIFQNKPVGDTMKYASVSLKDPAADIQAKYGFFYYPFIGNFIRPGKNLQNLIGYNDLNEPNFITVTHGNGRIFLHLHPAAFSNYFLLTGNNKEYFEKAMSYTASGRETVYWDDYYRLGLSPVNENFSKLGVFMKYPMLKWALLLAGAALLLYIAVGSKRRQRIIPVKIPNTNSSVSFVETIGRLYLQKKDNNNIAHKMITYFMEKIRTTYYLNTSQVNSEFFSSLSKKSGVEEADVKQFFQYMANLQQTESISDEELLNLNNQIQLYFKQ
jgi:hypothetical protein